MHVWELWTFSRTIADTTIKTPTANHSLESEIFTGLQAGIPSGLRSMPGFGYLVFLMETILY